MSIDTIKRILLFLAFALAQALLFNRIQLFNSATPLFYVYFVLMFPRNYPKWGILLWSFALGFIVDMFSNTPGVACASMTLIGALQPYLLMPFLPHDSEENHPSSAAALGWRKFLSYASVVVLIYCLVFFSLEAFTFFNGLHWISSVLGSAVLTTTLIMTFESFRGNKNESVQTVSF
jgi:rod shape-determining protein MreD